MKEKLNSFLQVFQSLFNLEEDKLESNGRIAEIEGKPHAEARPKEEPPAVSLRRGVWGIVAGHSPVVRLRFQFTSIHFAGDAPGDRSWDRTASILLRNVQL